MKTTNSTNGSYKGDTPEQIQMCLNCPREECNNCLGKYESGNGTSTKKLLKLQELLELNLTDAEMAELLEVTTLTVYRMRKKLGVPGYRERMKQRKEMMSA